jgi:multidrug efflux system outer membrane protein
MNRRPTFLRLVLLAAVVPTACTTVGPDYHRPDAALDAAFVVAGTPAPNSNAAGADIATFWRGFGDPKLDALVQRALEANGDVKLAQARLQEARALQEGIDAAARPVLGIDASATRAVRPITQQPGASRAARTGNTYDASFLANWEFDIFGRLRRGSEAAAAQVDAVSAGLHAAHTAMAAEVARNYLDLRALQQRQLVAEVALANQRDVLRIVQARLDNGRGTQIDLERVRALVAGTEAALPALQTAVERGIFRLATLTAQPPRALLAELGTTAPMPGLPVTDLAALPLGTPQQWLQRRPDIVAAERQLAAATAGIGVALADLYPRVSLSGLLGLNTATVANLIKGEFARYSLGAGVTWTPFDLGSVRSRIRASEARAQQSLATFEQTVALALEETEGAFSSFTRNAQRAERLGAAVRAADEVARLARVRYEAGATDFLTVLDAEREALNDRDALVQAQSVTATALVAIYRALGGGWPAATSTLASR